MERLRNANLNTYGTVAALAGDAFATVGMLLSFVYAQSIGFAVAALVIILISLLIEVKLLHGKVPLLKNNILRGVWYVISAIIFFVLLYVWYIIAGIFHLVAAIFYIVAHFKQPNTASNV